MTYSRIGASPVGITAYPVQPTPGAEPVLRVQFNVGSMADLSAQDAVALANYILEKFPKEILS